jgi:hypothetical protein
VLCEMWLEPRFSALSTTHHSSPMHGLHFFFSGPVINPLLDINFALIVRFELFSLVDPIVEAGQPTLASLL